MILATKEVIRRILKVISATTKVILTTDEVIRTTLKVISATKKVILTTEEVITAILDLSNSKSYLGQWINDNNHLKNYVSHYKSDLCYCSIFLAPDRNSRFHADILYLAQLLNAQHKLKKKSSSLWTCSHQMIILRSQKTITDFLMILAWLCRFKILHQNRIGSLITYSST